MSSKANSRCSTNVYSSMAKVNVSDVNPLRHMPYIVHMASSFRPLPTPVYVNPPLSRFHFL